MPKEAPHQRRAPAAGRAGLQCRPRWVFGLRAQRPMSPATGCPGGPRQTQLCAAAVRLAIHRPDSVVHPETHAHQRSYRPPSSCSYWPRTPGCKLPVEDSPIQTRGRRPFAISLHSSSTPGLHGYQRTTSKTASSWVSGWVANGPEPGGQSSIPTKRPALKLSPAGSGMEGPAGRPWSCSRKDSQQPASVRTCKEVRIGSLRAIRCPQGLPMPRMRHALPKPNKRAVMLGEPGRRDQLGDRLVAQFRQDL